MKHLITLIFCLFIFACDSSYENQDNFKTLVSVDLHGTCRDIERASAFKELDKYEVEGNFSVFEVNQEEIYSSGFLYTTEAEEERRIQMFVDAVETMNKDNFIDNPPFSNNLQLTKNETPYIYIYKISEDVFKSDSWELEAFHSYIKSDNLEDYRHYGMNKAFCSLEVKSRDGSFESLDTDKINWCFDTECSFNI